MKFKFSSITSLSFFTFLFSCKEHGSGLPATIGIDKVEVDLTEVVASKTEEDKYAMVFVAKQDSNLQLPIVIGAFEAQALAIAIEQIPHDAPLPLDLFETLLIQSGFILDHVVIDSLIDSIYSAKIMYTAIDKKKIIKSRCCDAVTLAIKFDRPIFMAKALLKNY